MTYLKRVSRLIIALLMVPHLCFAQLVNPLEAPNLRANEYFVGRELGKTLITVNLLNGVNSPGVYHIPIDTNLAQLIAYAGGSHEDAELDSVAIQRTIGKRITLVDIDLKKSIRSNQHPPVLMHEDIIQIPLDRSADNTAQWAGIISTIASIILVGFVISEKTE